MTERDYLVSLGLAKPGRGRFSNDGKAALAKAKADGKTFEDSKSAPAPSKNKGARGAAPAKSQAKQWHDGTVVPVADIPVVAKSEKPVTWQTPTPPVRQDRKFDKWESPDGVQKSIRDCCQNKGCGFSIGWCHCPVPFVFNRDDILVPLAPVQSSRNLALT